jgi:hypothetical protein
LEPIPGLIENFDMEYPVKDASDSSVKKTMEIEKLLNSFLTAII